MKSFFSKIYFTYIHNYVINTIFAKETMKNVIGVVSIQKIKNKTNYKFKYL